MEMDEKTLRIKKTLSDLNYNSNKLFQYCLNAGFTVKQACEWCYLINQNEKINDIEEVYIKTFIKTFEDVCNVLNIDINLFNKKCIGLPTSEIAYKKLKLIIKLFNNNWQKDWNNPNEYYYVPYFKMSGDSFSYYYCHSWLAISVVGFGWGFKSKELMLHCVKYFLEEYKGYMISNNNENDEFINSITKKELEFTQ